MSCGILFDHFLRFCGWVEPSFESYYGAKDEAQAKVVEKVRSKETCAICFDSFAKGNNDVYMTPCLHFFHEKCVQQMTDHNLAAPCPCCRKDISFNKTKKLWKDFFASIQKGIDFPLNEEEEQEFAALTDDEIAALIYRQELAELDQETQDRILAMELAARH